ncbi:hypothetical protein D9M69_564120 [compost metagenome]
MRCEGTARVLAEIYSLADKSSSTQREVVSLYRCAAVDGDIDAQMKLTALMAGKGGDDLEIQPDLEEASRWYLRVRWSDSASSVQSYDTEHWKAPCRT